MEGPAFRFFHDQLPDDRQREFYTRIEEAVRRRADQIDCPSIPGLTRGDYVRILEHVYSDHEEFFSFYPLRSDVFPLTDRVTVRLFYRYTEAVQREYENALDQAVRNILRELFPDGYESVSELKREKLLFDWITRNVVYDNVSLTYSKQNNEAEQVKSAAWNAYGALVLRNAVCEGIACGFKLLCDRVGLASIVVSGQASGGRHAWNVVRVHGKFYHVDCTWDLQSSIARHVPYMRYRYFNLPDQIICKNHTPETAFLPVCGSLQYNPFRIRNLCAFKPEEVTQIAIRMADAGEKRFGVMTVGFSAQDCAQTASNILGIHVHRKITFYTDTSGCFIGFVL